LIIFRKISLKNKFINCTKNSRFKLPNGLVCDHCVLQWTHHSSFKHEVTYPPEYAGWTGWSDAWNQFNRQYMPRQHFVNCADVRIKPNTNIYPVFQSYPQKPQPLARPSTPIFVCSDPDTIAFPNSQELFQKGYEIVRNDLLRYRGVGVNCWKTNPTDSNFCAKCRDNCMTPSKQCPYECLCRWFDTNYN